MCFIFDQSDLEFTDSLRAGKDPILVSKYYKLIHPDKIECVFMWQQSFMNGFSPILYQTSDAKSLRVQSDRKDHNLTNKEKDISEVHHGIHAFLTVESPDKDHYENLNAIMKKQHTGKDFIPQFILVEAFGRPEDLVIARSPGAFERLLHSRSAVFTQLFLYTHSLPIEVVRMADSIAGYLAQKKVFPRKE